MIDFQLFAFLFYKKNILFTTKYHQKNFRNLSCSSKEKPIWQMQGSELVELIQSSISGISTTNEPTEKKYVYGISGIQKLLNCSESSAKRLKKSGVINEAIIQNGRKIIIDVEKALELLKKNQKIGR